MQEENQPQEPTLQSTITEPKKPKKLKIKPVLYVLVTIVLMFSTGAGVWLYMNNKQDKAASEFQQQISTLQSKKSQSTTKPKPTPASNTASATTASTGSSAQSSVHAVALKTFCQGTNPDTMVGTMQYVENANGFYGLCGISSKSQPAGGYILVASYSGGKWQKVWAGNGMMEQSMCTKYKIPTSIYPDCTGNY